MYASVGDGHKSTAEAIYEQLSMQKDINLKLIDIFDFSKINIAAVINRINSKNLIFGLLYNFIWNQDSLKRFGNNTSSLLNINFQSLHNYIDSFSPDLVICTHALAAFVSINHRIKIPVVAIVTDNRVSPAWISSKIDYYFVSNKVSKIDLVTNGININKIFNYGIPLKSQFYGSNLPKPSTNKLSILVLAVGFGIYGYPDMFSNKLIKEIRIIEKIYNVTVVCGKNNRFKEKMIQSKLKGVKLLGFTKNMADLMSQSSIIVTKPGGVATSEALYLGKPIIFIDKGFGQEKRHIEYLVNSGSAIELQDISNLSYVLKLLENSRLLKIISNSTSKKKQLNSTLSIKEKIISIIKKS